MNSNIWQNKLRYHYNDIVRKQNFYLELRSSSFSFSYTSLSQEIKYGRLIIGELNESSNSYGMLQCLQAEPGNSKCSICLLTQCQLIQNKTGLLEVPKCKHHFCFGCIMNWIDECSRKSVIANKVYSQIVCPCCHENLFSFLI